MSTTLAESTAPPLARKRWTPEEFDRLARSDFFAGRERLALRDGEVVTEGESGTIPKRWTIAEVDRLVREGILRHKSPEFLWDGELITPMPENPPHVNAGSNLADELRDRLPRDSWTINYSSPLDLSETFLPEPGIVVARGPRSNYREARATAADAALVVEVAHTSYYYDSGLYLGRYAMGGIPLYWIIHIKPRRVEVYSCPIPEEARYGHRTDYGMGDVVPLSLAQGGQTFDYEGIAVEAILRDSLED